MKSYIKTLMLSCAILSLVSRESMCAIIPFEKIITTPSTEATNTTSFWKFIDERTYVIVKFYEGWCGPCRSLSQVVERVMKKYPKIDVLEIAASKYPITGFHITSIPTVVYFENSKQVALHQGYVFDDVFEGQLKSAFGL